jgi:lysophospholipase L1-like esterase
VIAVIGDSYMSGYGMPTPDKGMASLMADHLGMKLDNFAVGTTGYVSKGPSADDHSYPVQAKAAIAAHADLYIVEGGLNDWALVYKDKTLDLDALRQAVHSLYQRLIAAEGADNVIVVGPVWPYDIDAPGISEVNDLLKSEAAAAGLGFVDPFGEEWITPENNDQYIGPDLAHPNELGQVYLGRKLADAIDALR